MADFTLDRCEHYPVWVKIENFFIGLSLTLMAAGCLIIPSAYVCAYIFIPLKIIKV